MNIHFGHIKLRHEICQKIYTTGFSGPIFHTLKVRKLLLFLLKMNERICIICVYALTSVNWVIFCSNLTECVNFQQFQCKITLGVCKSFTSTKIMQESTFFFRKNLHSWDKFYTTAGRDGRDKSQL